MKYLIGGIAVVITLLVYFINSDNKADAERLKQAEIAHQQKIEQEKKDAIQAEKEATIRAYQKEAAKAEKAQQEKAASQKSAREFAQRQEDEKRAGIKKIEDKVKEMAFDPSSVQFRNQKGNCGEVNGKNRYGGYTGFKKYIYNPETNTVSLEDLDKFYTAEIMHILWNEKCG